MYKILVVDDEEIIRDGLMSFDWESLGFCAAAEASDGKEALEVISSVNPDVIITDIRMPVMDGLELSRQISENHEQCKIIFLSGYNDFEYAHMGMKYGVVDFLLKPVDLRELRNVFISVKSQLDAEQKKNSELRKLLLQNRISHKNAIEAFVKDLLTGNSFNVDYTNEKLNLLEMDLSGDNFTCAVLHIHSDLFMKHNICAEDKSMLRFAFDNIASELLESQNCGFGYIDDNMDIVLLFNFKKDCKDIKQMIINFIYELKIQCEQYLNKMYPGCISAGIGNTYNSILNIPVSFKEAYRALEAVFKSSAGQIIHIGNIEHPMDSIFTVYPYDKEKLLLDCISKGITSEFQDSLHQYIIELEAISSKVNSSSMKRLIIQLMGILERHFQHTGMELNEILEINIPIEEHIMQYDSFHSLKGFLVSALEKCIDYTCSIKPDSKPNSLAITKAKKFIQGNYNKKITLEEVAGSVYLTPNYFSLIFKRDTGENFIEYIKKIRIDKAKEFLKRTDLKVYEVSELVGYENPKYFTDMFKKYTGQSPLEYKNSQQV